MITVLFLHREINKGFSCKSVNRIPGFCLGTIYLPADAVGTKSYMEIQKELVRMFQCH